MCFFRLLIPCLSLIGFVDPLLGAPLQNNESLLADIERVHGLNKLQRNRLRGIFGQSRWIGQGNPAISHHPLTPNECHAIRTRTTDDSDSNIFSAICGGGNMAPLYDPATQDITQARACIDQFEFPDIPCAYPVVWVRASEAAQICEAMGKRLCDAHEWEGACTGQLRPIDYHFDLAVGVEPNVAIQRMRSAHNTAHRANKRWSYGDSYQRGVCGTASQKSAECLGGSWSACGSNTYPSGSFPSCRSTLGVYDLHGNAAEHMNLPLDASQMSSRGSKSMGYTEMKGSWFIFDTFYAHEDWCQWRAPFWHGSKVKDPNSHANYHLGFRCCKTLTERKFPQLP